MGYKKRYFIKGKTGFNQSRGFYSEKYEIKNFNSSFSEKISKIGKSKFSEKKINSFSPIIFQLIERRLLKKV